MLRFYLILFCLNLRHISQGQEGLFRRYKISLKQPCPQLIPMAHIQFKLKHRIKRIFIRKSIRLFSSSPIFITIIEVPIMTKWRTQNES